MRNSSPDDESAHRVTDERYPVVFFASYQQLRNLYAQPFSQTYDRWLSQTLIAGADEHLHIVIYLQAILQVDKILSGSLKPMNKKNNVFSFIFSTNLGFFLILKYFLKYFDVSLWVAKKPTIFNRKVLAP